jgi:AcrR family transcriptional regulator
MADARALKRSEPTTTRDRILQASLARFVVAGYRGTSVREIAEDVGVTQPALYYHFGSKDGILASLIEPLLSAGDELLESIDEIPGAPADVVRVALSGYFDVIVEHLDVFLFVETDRSVRSHPVAGHRLAAQAARLLDVMSGGDGPDARVRAAAALGAIRRPLRLRDVDVVAHKPLILACAQAALHASVEPARSAPAG